jgi:CheY-like chemotaxis protein
MREVLADTVKFALSGSNLKVKIAFRDKIPPLSLDEGQMRQVFSNLAFNARDAMPAGGLLAVTIEQAVITWKDALPVPSGRYVKIVFRDHGCGISQENIGRIFDPYFTTKELGARKGQGLGLTICHSIIVRHGGAIIVESEPGQGAAFTIYLPIAEPVAGRTPAARAMTRVESAASRTILVMDDEEWIRNLLGDLLKHMGHEVTTVPDSASAIEAYRAAQSAGRPFDLVILDLTIQGGPGGLATMKELLALDPAARGVISSGYADDPAVLNYRKCGFVAAMAKPYSVATLQKIIAELFPG